MKLATLTDLVSKRRTSKLETWAGDSIANDGWNSFLTQLQEARHGGKSRDVLVQILGLEPVGGMDVDLFKTFASLEGESLQQVRANALDHAMGLLREQVQNRHTYFLDVEAMATSPFAVLVKDVIEARKKELEDLERTPSRIDVLGTYYGFSILMIDGSQSFGKSTATGYYGWRRRSWIDPELSDTAVDALKKLTGEFANVVDVDKTYRTLGSSRIFKNRCTKQTAEILANIVRLTLYKAPGNRATAARKLGRTEDSRCLPFLHHRLSLEAHRKTRIAIIGALERIGHPSSVAALKPLIGDRYLTHVGLSAVKAIGGLYSAESKETLVELLETGRRPTLAAAIEALSGQDTEGLVKLLTPYVTHKSRPVSRAAVLTLVELGKDGKDAIRRNASVVIKRIGYDKPSRAALNAMLTVPGIGKMESIQQYFAKRIEKLTKDLRRWRQQDTNRYYGYYWRRREARVREQLIHYTGLAARHLRPPFDAELTKAVTASLTLDDEQGGMKRTLGESALAQALRMTPFKETKYVQTFLSLFR